MKSAAIFLDRDGTIIHDVGYANDPESVELIEGSAEAIRRFAEAGYLVVLASNQSGIARGLLTEEDLDSVHEQLETLLSDEGAQLDGAYYCPYLDGPEAKVKDYRRDSELRKPKPGMLLQAARELNVDLKQSWMIGDKLSDVQAGDRAGCQTIFLTEEEDESSNEELEEASTLAAHVVPSLYEAADAILGEQEEEEEETVETQKEDNPMASDRVIAKLEQIHECLDRADRDTRQDDFSFIRLGGALLQMFAIVVALWGAVALFNDYFDAAAARFALACFLQLASVSAFAIDRFK